MKLTDLKEHQVAALKNGGGVIVDGNVVGIADFEDGHSITPQNIDAGMELAKAKAEVEELKAELAKLKKGKKADDKPAQEPEHKPEEGK